MSLGPNIPGLLGGTLQGQDVLTMMQALQQREQEALVQRSKEAEAAASAAQQQYTQAAAQPPPQLDPAQALIPLLLGNIASVVSRDPSFRDRGRENVRQSQSDLLKARHDNLTALRDVYSQKASQAEKAGDLEGTEKFRRQFETLSKTLEVLGQKQRGAADLEEQKHRNRLAEIAARTEGQQAARAGEPDENEDAANSVVAGETQITDYPIYQRPKINAIIRQSGRKITPKKVRDTLQSLSAARGAIDNIEGLSATVNVARNSPLGIERQITGARKSFEAATQTGSDAALFGSATEGFLATIARAVGEKGTLTDQDAARARSLIPKFRDTKEVAQRKIKQLRDFLDELETRTVKTYTEPGAGVGQPTEARIRVVGPRGQKGSMSLEDFKKFQSKGWKRAPVNGN